MLIVGELINASRKSVREIIEKQDAAAVAQLARSQTENGAGYIDVNAGVFVGREPELLKWMVTTVQDAVEAPCCIDSPDPKAMVMAIARGLDGAIVNPLDARMMGCIVTAEMLIGRDDYCVNYLKAFRAGKLTLT